MEGLIRQGDILLFPVDDAAVLRRLRSSKLSKAVRRTPGLGLVIAEGEVTGHHHVVSTKGAKLREVDGVLYLITPEGGGELEHDEHETLKVPKGAHRIVNQREYIPPATPSQAPRQSYVRD